MKASLDHCAEGSLDRLVGGVPTLSLNLLRPAKLWLITAVAVIAAGAPSVTALSGRRGTAESRRVAVLISPRPSVRTASNAIVQALEAKGHNCTLVELPNGDDGSARAAALKQLVELDPAVMATGGTTATTLALEAFPHTPAIFFMAPNVLDAPFWADGAVHKNRVAGVTTDVSPDEQVSWLTRLHPSGRRIALLHSPRSEKTAQATKREAARHGVTIVLVEARKDEFPEAIERLNQADCDSVIMIPDAQVYNVTTVQRLLLWGVRHKKPVWAFSENVVKAGALAGQYCSAEDVGRQTAQVIDRVLRGTDVATIGLQYPRRIARAVNEHIAKTIGISLRAKQLDATIVHFGGNG